MLWKITAIAVIVLFMLLIVGGLIKVYYLKSSLIKPTQAQVDYVTKIATERLQSTGNNASMFQIHVGSRIRREHEDGTNRDIIQVSFNNNVTSHMYLIDVNTGEVLLHSQTDMYIDFGGHQKKRHHNKYPFFKR